MNIIFMRHGEATDNVKKIISDKEIYWSILTKKGEQAVIDSVKLLPSIIDKIYYSPFPRTVETAYYVLKKYPKAETIVDYRLREIYYGKYSGKTNNAELDNIRIKQINGDYFTRFGDYGENKFDIEIRLCNFLNDIYVTNDNRSTIVIVSHGSIISYMKRLLNIITPHINTGQFEEFNNVDFNFLLKYIEKLKKLNM